MITKNKYIKITISTFFQKNSIKSIIFALGTTALTEKINNIIKYVFKIMYSSIL